MEALGPDTVRSIARLARLALTDDECERYGRELGKILEAFDALARADLPACPSSGGVGLPKGLGAVPAAVFLPAQSPGPESIVKSMSSETFLRAAPDREGDFVRVPAILGGNP
jgi:Asp-tRNA(Asn)/Glu-tRNA(Gln) amidotransferase C subunit